MTDMGQPTQKEVTILELAVKANDKLREIEFMLEKSFQRNTPDTEKVEEKPQIPNILDEIIQQLELADTRISETYKFIYEKIIKKIH